MGQVSFFCFWWVASDKKLPIAFVFRVNDQRVGLSMAIAQEILRRQRGHVIFRKESENRGVFTILMEEAAH